MNEPNSTMLPVKNWVERLDAAGRGEGPLTHQFVETYARQAGDLGDVIARYRDLLLASRDRWGPDAKTGILRSPGRVNLMGRHVDHQGGHCNLMAIDREILLAFRPREDGTFHLANVDRGVFPEQEFSLDDLRRHPENIAARAASGLKSATWGVYFQAAALRIQERFPDRPLRGFDAVVSGNIPMGAGLSSSSALVVACAETLVRVNRLAVSGEELVDECGEGEKYVGTRGGSADHAAIRLSNPGEILHVTFFPFRIERRVPFPEDHAILVCHSGDEAHKAVGARNIFNGRVTAYAMARELIRHTWPETADRVTHLRDINRENLEVSPADIYRMVLSLPEQMDRRTFLEKVSAESGERIKRELFAAHDEPADGYPVRGVGLYGLAECRRSARCADFLEAGDTKSIGEEMLISHESERVVRHDADLCPSPVVHDTGDAMMERLIERSEAGEPDAALWRQPGYYQCSTEGIDRIVDAATQVPGAAGAQLAGAGLGGCAMVLVHRDALPDVQEKLIRSCYEPKGIEPLMIPCRPVRGCGTIGGW